jgi:hypothetical protein
MQTLPTPEFRYTPRYCEIADSEGGRLRVAWVAGIFASQMRSAQGIDHPTQPAFGRLVLLIGRGLTRRKGNPSLFGSGIWLLCDYGTTT